MPGDLGIPGVELRSHCTYRRDEILAGIGWADGVRKTRGQAAGVVYSETTNVDALLVTLRKEDKEFAPSTRYRDYPISADLFHWESQNSTTQDSKVGRRYLDGTSHVVLFARAARNDEFGGGAPFVCLGTAQQPSSTTASARSRSPGASTARCPNRCCRLPLLTQHDQNQFVDGHLATCLPDTLLGSTRIDVR